VTEFGSFDNSTCKRVVDLLKPGDLTEGIEWVDIAEVTDAGRLVVLLTVIYR